MTAYNKTFFKPLHFAKNNQKEFEIELRKEVNEYFQDKKVKRTGGWRFALKLPLVLAIYFVPFILILTGLIQNYWILALLAIIMGFGMAIIGMAVMHDANHGSASSKGWVNFLVGNVINFIGGFAVNWRIQHNVLHHTYTNVDGYDEDLESTPLLRFSPHTPKKKAHRFQHIYAPFFYSILTLYWCTTKDFEQLNRFNRLGLLKTQNTSFGIELLKLIASKLLYYGYIFGLTIWLTDYGVLPIVVGFLLMHVVAGLLLSLVFQPAHVVETSIFPEVESDVEMEDNWLVHQLKTTKNFGTGSRALTWFIGGLNHQIEHHLFPGISHVHYSKIAPIVERIAKKYQIPYYNSQTFFAAVREHFFFLKQLGKAA